MASPNPQSPLSVVILSVTKLRHGQVTKTSAAIIFIIAISCVVNRRFKLNFTPTTIQERKSDYSTVITLKIKISAEEKKYPQKPPE
ncbi:TPA: hypothetical protein QIY89_003804 [Escherichia coli]|nr:hypothetical protein [Escherichia coli]EFA4297039.1 hypothetical protein [Escherichia coli O18:H7]EFA3638915.1 hypothetical protein [Escherichia coli]EFA9201158.1 hypothetical protein [Escherichia coli]EFB2329417.1 hypothetical protein [Escherichia coli]EFB5239381.1 hypothetical protein [Escherichia coli]